MGQTNSLTSIFDFWWVLLLILGIVIMAFAFKYVIRLLGIIIIPDDQIGLVTKKFALFGANRELPPGKIIALNGEAGKQADTLAPGLHFWLWPWQYDIEIVKFFVVPNGHIGIVQSCDGNPMPDGRVIARVVPCDNFQDARAFLQAGGERGPQMDVIPPGTWRINTLVFDVNTVKMVEIPDNQIGVVEARDGSPLTTGRVVARHVDCNMYQDGKMFMEAGGERGPQMGVIPPGKYRINPYMFNVQMANITNIPDDQIGVVEARDGNPLPTGHVIAHSVDCNMYQDGKMFMEAGGERGPQMVVVPPGKYRINPFMFNVQMVDITDIPDNHIGVITTKEGQPLAKGDIAGKEVPDHNMYQDPQAFVDHGGFKGLQEQVLLAGRYYINPNFATVENVEMTKVPIAHVGVVIAYVGEEGKDLTGDTFKHGNLVQKGQRGVWITPLDPGNYPMNPHTHKVELVPTANVVLNWATGKTESHKLDEKLSTIKALSADGFKFSLDVSQVIHVPNASAPKVIARFGSMANLVTQVLEPTIGNYFRNAAQKSNVIDFLAKRQERQNEAKEAIEAGLQGYDVCAVDTLIGDIVPPDDLMKTLTDKKIAEQQRQTFETQQAAEEQRKDLEQAKAMADTQATVVNAERQVSIREFEAKAKVKAAEGDAKSKTINAEADAQVKTVNAKADAEVLTMVGNAEGTKITAVGEAEAKVMQLKTDAMGQGNYAQVQIAQALAGANVPIVPQIVVDAGKDNGGKYNLMEVFLAGMIQKDINNQQKEVVNK